MVCAGSIFLATTMCMRARTCPPNTTSRLESLSLLEIKNSWGKRKFREQENSLCSYSGLQMRRFSNFAAWHLRQLPNFSYTHLYRNSTAALSALARIPPTSGKAIQSAGATPGAIHPSLELVLMYAHARKGAGLGNCAGECRLTEFTRRPPPT